MNTAPACHHKKLRHRAFRGVLSAVFLVISAMPAAGSDAGYSVRQWDVKEGLPQSSVSDVVQTPDGFLWIGTLHSGLARFDGASFECYDLANTPQLGHAGIRRLLIDKPGRLWVNTYGPGLLVLEDGGFKPVLSPVPPVDALLAADTDTALFVLPENHIYQVRRGSDGVWRGEKLPNFTENPVTNWVGAADGIAWYRRQDGRIGRFEKDRRIDLPGLPGFDETRASSLQSDRDGRVWITSGNRFGVWDGRIFEDASPLGGEPLTDLVRVAPAGAGSVWVETTHRLRLCRDRQWIAESKDWDPKLYGPPIGRARRTDDEAGLWIQVTDLGLAHVRADGLFRHNDRKTWEQTPADEVKRRANLFARFLAARQRGVERARREAGAKKCRVLHAAEVNRVWDAARKIPTVMTHVLPSVAVDLVSWSCYDGLKKPSDLWQGIEMLRHHMLPSPALGGKPVFLGEIGEPENLPGKTEAGIVDLWDWAMGVCFALDVPWVVHWELFCNEPNDGTKPNRRVRKQEELKGFWFVRPDGSLGHGARYISHLIQHAGSTLPDSLRRK